MNHPPRIRVVGSVSFFPFPSAIVLIRNGMRSSSSKLPWLLETGSPTVRTDRWRSARTRPLPVVAQISARLVRGRVVLARISGSRRPDPTPALTGRPMAVRLKREPHRSGMAGGRGARQKHQAKADPGRVLPVVPFPDRSGAAYRVAGCRGGLARAYCRYLGECCGWACEPGSCKTPLPVVDDAAFADQRRMPSPRPAGSSCLERMRLPTMCFLFAPCSVAPTTQSPRPACSHRHLPWLAVSTSARARWCSSSSSWLARVTFRALR